MLFPVHKTLRSSTERLEEHRKENKETEKKKEKKDRERKKKQCLACSLVMQCTTIFPSGFILFFFFLLSYATWHSIIRGILRWKHCRKVAFVVLFLFFLSFLSPVLRRRDTFTQKHRAKTRLNNDHFLSSSSLPLPFLPLSFSRFSRFAFFSIDSFRTRYNTQRIETRRNAANYIMRGLGRKWNDNRRS